MTEPHGSSASAATTFLTVASAGVGALSYGCSLALAHLLAPGAYTAAAAATALVGTAGVAAAALVPLPLAHAVRAAVPGSAPARDALAFATAVSLLAGVLAAGLLAGITAGFAGPGTAAAAGVSGFALFAIAPVWGLLQGRSRFGRFAALTLAEVGTRVAASLVAARCGGGAAAVVLTFALGAAVVLVLGLAGPARELLSAGLPRPAALADRGRWAATGGVAAVQALLSLMTAADVVVLATVATDPRAAAGYQAVATVAKAPLYVAASSALVSFPLLRAAGPDRRAALARAAVGSFLRLAVPAAVVVATLPAGPALLVLPAAYAPALRLLPLLALAGAGLGAVSVLATVVLAAGGTRRLAAGLSAAALALGGGLAAGAAAGVPGLARGAAAGALAGAAAMAVAARPLLIAGRRPRAGAAAAAVAAAGGVLALLAACRPSTPAWLAALVLVAALTGAGPLLGRAARAAAGSAAGHAEPPPAPGALRVLHLGFEDPAMPGAGGGSLRTAEVNRRLAAAGHRVTVLTTGFPGAVDRTEAHGAGSVRWVHVGLGRGAGRLSRLLGYVLLAPVVVRATAADLVVEDFFAPVSSVAAPWWSRRPTVGVVQWLNAREKAREYHLPVHAVERLGVRSHRRLVAVSEGVARRLAATGSRAEVTVIGNGVDLAALTAGGPGGRGDDVVFVGRLEIAQKGLDLLVDAWSRIAADVPGRLVLAGSGPDEAALRARVADRGLSGRVVFPGWVDGAAKTALLRGARLVAVPSRFETFGIVAVEALAAGSPVVAYDIDCLREVVPPGCGSLVPVTGAPAADAAALADAVLALYRDPSRRRSAAAEGPRWAARWNWDAVAAAQEAVYREVARAGSRVPAPAGPRLLPAPPRRILEARP